MHVGGGFTAQATFLTFWQDFDGRNYELACLDIREGTPSPAPKPSYLFISLLASWVELLSVTFTFTSTLMSILGSSLIMNLRKESARSLRSVTDNAQTMPLSDTTVVFGLTRGETSSGDMEGLGS